MTHPSHKQMTTDELSAEMQRRFGTDSLQWAFICPQCKDIATLGDFFDAGVNPAVFGQECIGRSLGALSKEFARPGDDESKLPKYEGRGCNWAAYGLFRGPVEYLSPEGKSTWGFEIAPAPEKTDD